MLELSNISKAYVMPSFTQRALDEVSLAFRDNEFVAILGPSGSGKTTLLNVIGGLDHFDSGDLIIDGISTKDYHDRDWDAYRNNRIGFVFQSYNLIPHQTVLANVELALTLSGVNAQQRQERAREALAKVGLAEHADKRPSQLSGGQMQRVAIARALINDPEILLADEPTGALDSTTSVAVMDLLKEVAHDRLVIMVTHNPELAESYATRIVQLQDGKIISDSNPFDPTSQAMRSAKPARRTSMSFLTALSLSFNNLMTKKGRTILTALAGSIGIIGIAAILGLANGVNEYIKNVEEETLSVYPLQIMDTGFDISSLIVDQSASTDSNTTSGAQSDEQTDDTTTLRDVPERQTISNMFSRVGRNDLASLKSYLDQDGGDISTYVNDIEYSYNVVPQIFDASVSEGYHQINPDSSFDRLGFNSASAIASFGMSMSVFDQLPQKTELFEEQYELITGAWPTSYDEMLLVLNRDGSISDYVSYVVGLRDPSILDAMVASFAQQEEPEVPTDKRSYTIDELMERPFKLVHASDYYHHDTEFNVWTNKSDDKAFMRSLVENGEDLHISGVVKLKDGVDAAALSPGIYYTANLVMHVIEHASQSEIYLDQKARSDIDVLTGKSFDEEALGQDNSNFDMSSLFSIDGDKISAAFSFDEAALQNSMSNLDFSNMDMSGLDSMNLDLSSLGPMDVDMGSLNLGAAMPELDLSALSNNDLSQTYPDLGTIDYPALLQNVLSEGAIASDAGERMGALLSSMAQEYIAYNQAHAESDYASNLRAYLDQASVQQRLNEQTSTIVNTQVIFDRVTQNLGATPASTGVANDINNRLIQSVSTAMSNYMSELISRMLANYLEQTMSVVMSQMMSTVSNQISNAMQQNMSDVFGNMASAMKIDENKFKEAFNFSMDEQELAELMASLMSTTQSSYEGNLTRLGYADIDKPSRIDIYSKDFDAKARVVDIIEGYNQSMRDSGDEGKVVTYTDLVGVLMASVTRIIDMITTMLIAFVSISLIVSSIMIGVITLISVLERKKEIGILRSIGASKRDISNVFNAETFIEGLVAGVLGIVITNLGAIPANIIVENTYGVKDIVRLPPVAALILVGISIVLTLLAGLIPAMRASRSDPVEALRGD